MPKIFDERLALWASAPSQTEQDKCDNAERAVRKAIAASPTLAARNVIAFAQGSYRNRTNVRTDSDVDVCVLCKDTYFYDVPPGTTIATFGGATPAVYTFQQFRADVEGSLRQYFGGKAVGSGKKAFDIHENTYRIAADAVPCFEGRWYGHRPPAIGTAFIADGGTIFNYPDQHYANGIEKNKNTSRRFKAIVRILKHFRYEMLAAGVASSRPMASFLIESLVWNVPNSQFGSTSLRDDLKAAILFIYQNTKSGGTCMAWPEINGVKNLFISQPWTPAEVNSFMVDVWAYAELS